MTLFEQWTLVNYIANKDYEGNVITPDTFKELVKLVNLELFNVKMGLPSDYVPGQVIPRQSFDLNKILTAETLFLREYNKTEPVTDGVISYPADFFIEDVIRYNLVKNIDDVNETLPRPVEIIEEAEYSDRAGNYTKKPTTKNPVAVMRKAGIYVYPTVISVVEFAYIRYPVDPVFAYNQETGYITYDSDNSTEYEWGKNLHWNLTVRILNKIGINIRESQVQQYAEMQKAEGV